MTRVLKASGIVAVVLALAAVPFVYAGVHQRHGHGGGDMGPLAHLAAAQKELGLSDAQVDQIKVIMKEAHESNAQFREQLHGGIQSVISTLIKNPNDIAAAQAIIDQQTQAERQLKSNLLNAASKALNVLTPDQREKLGTMIAEHHGRFNRGLF